MQLVSALPALFPTGTRWRMAKVVVTKSKLDSLAQHINTKAGTTGAKTIAQMQDAVDGIAGIVQWNDKFAKIVSPGTVETAAPITVKALCYYDGYWYGAGNDSAGDMYKLYGATTATLTAVKLASAHVYPVKGITCDGTHVIVCFEHSAYKNRTVIFQDVAAFRSTSTAYTYSRLSLTSYSFEDICAVNSGSNIASYVVGETGNQGIIVGFPKGSTSGVYKIIPSASGGFVSSCDWNQNAIFITANGYICKYIGNNTNYSGQTLTCLQGAKMIRSMNGNLFVICVRDDGTYLYWFESGVDITTSQPTGSIKITDEVLAIVGMAYAGGLYTVVGVNNTGAIKVLQSDNLFYTGIYGQTVALPSGYTPRVMATDETNICILADNGANVIKAMCTIK